MNKRGKTIATKQYWLYGLIGVLAISLLLVGAWALNERGQANQLRRNNTAQNQQAQQSNGNLEDHGITPLDSQQASNKPQTATELAYMIEEEKLAHDVYQAMYDKWGARVFGNIKNSETTHQNLVLGVMKSRNLSDPRKAEPGKFANTTLQALYDKFITQGNQNITEAYKVGVAIEERDIVDLKDALANLDSKDTDVKAVFENLLNGSENHLRAFNRQANR